MNEIINFGDKKKVKIIMLKGEKGEKGADGSSGDYSLLENKPQINDVEIDGNKTASDLGLVAETEFQQFENDTNTSIEKIQESMAWIEPNATSSSGYDVGSYIVHNGFLYKVIQNIDIGDTFDDSEAVGNIERVTVGGELHETKEELSSFETSMNVFKGSIVIEDNNDTASQTYEKGEIILHNGTLYRTNVVIHRGTAFSNNISEIYYTLATYVEQTHESISSIVQDISDLETGKQDEIGQGVYRNNIDDLKENSVWWVRKNEASGTQPNATYYMLQTVSTHATVHVQIAYPYGSATVAFYMRMFVNGAWTSWKTVSATT